MCVKAHFNSNLRLYIVGGLAGLGHHFMTTQSPFPFFFVCMCVCSQDSSEKHGKSAGLIYVKLPPIHIQPASPALCRTFPLISLLCNLTGARALHRRRRKHFPLSVCVNLLDGWSIYVQSVCPGCVRVQRPGFKRANSHCLL